MSDTPTEEGAAFDDIPPAPDWHYTHPQSVMTYEDIQAILKDSVTVTFGDGMGSEDLAYTFDVPLVMAWKYIEMLRQFGMYSAIQFVMMVVRPLYNTHPRKLLEPPIAIEARMRAMFGRLLERANNEHWESEIDMVLSATYHMLRARKITREAAARIASSFIHQPFTVDAWRMRTDRWARDRGLPKVEQRKRKNQTTTGS